MTPEAVLTYALNRGLLTNADVVDGSVIAADASRRHRNVMVSLAEGRGLFVKQHDFRQNARTLAREARIYEALGRHEPDFARHHMPDLLFYDPESDILILELLDSAEPMGGPNVRRSAVGERSARCLGQTLASLHDLAPSAVSAAPTPWVLSMLRLPMTVLDDFSTSALSAIAIIQQIGPLRDSLTDLESGAEIGMVHGDPRLDNCLVRSGEDATIPEALYLVDWELSGIGDTSSDVGGIFCDYLTAWVRSTPFAPTVSIADSLKAGALPLESATRSTASFWNAYRQRRVSWSGERGFLLRSVQWAGARLAQAAVEEAQNVGMLTTAAVLTLQLAENILAQPAEAGWHLLGLGGLE